MAAPKEKARSFDEYITFAREEVQQKLLQMHACILEAAPGASVGLKWGMPAYSYKRILVTFAVFKHHIGFYPTPSAVAVFAPKLTTYKTAESSIQFPLSEPLPLELIGDITRFRVKESLEEDVKWKG